MQFVLLLFVLFAVAIFVDIQRYLSAPDRRQRREEWFRQFAEFNRNRQSDPELAWRYSVIEQAFHRQG